LFCWVNLVKRLESKRSIFLSNRELVWLRLQS
jgi:hypothetical protein